LSVDKVLAHRCQLRVVDVRDSEELEGPLGSIEGAQHIPARRVALEALSWDRDAPVVFVCRSGRRSGVVAERLRDLGFTRVASMTGGMLDWNAARLPLSSTPPSPPRPAPPATLVRTVTRDDITAHVTDGHQIHWTKAAALILHGTQACVDGRDAHPIVGTPGGDAGELIVALAAAEQLSGQPLSTAEVERMFDAHLEAFGRFYLHTDQVAVAALLERLHAQLPDRQIPVTGPEVLAEFVAHPPTWARSALLEQLAEPANVGCGHLRLMLQDPAEYGVRSELVADVLRTFFKRLWEGHPALEFVVLEGGHRESAVLSVELPGPVHAHTRIPLVSPRLADTEIFVAHPEVARFIRRENAAFVLEHLSATGSFAGAPDEFFTAIDALAERQMQATLHHLAPDIPRFRVRFRDGSFEVDGPYLPQSTGTP
jgi:rhodanese-related sulfurtransferase